MSFLNESHLKQLSASHPRFQKIRKIRVLDSKDTKPMLRSKLMLFEYSSFHARLFPVLLLFPHESVT